MLLLLMLLLMGWMMTKQAASMMVVSFVEQHPPEQEVFGREWPITPSLYPCEAVVDRSTQQKQQLPNC